MPYFLERPAAAAVAVTAATVANRAAGFHTVAIHTADIFVSDTCGAVNQTANFREAGFFRDAFNHTANHRAGLYSDATNHTAILSDAANHTAGFSIAANHTAASSDATNHTRVSAGFSIAANPTEGFSVAALSLNLRYEEVGPITCRPQLHTTHLDPSARELTDIL